jgi:hypothetical protein
MAATPGVDAEVVRREGEQREPARAPGCSYAIFGSGSGGCGGLGSGVGEGIGLVSGG